MFCRSKIREGFQNQGENVKTEYKISTVSDIGLQRNRLYIAILASLNRRHNFSSPCIKDFVIPPLTLILAKMWITYKITIPHRPQHDALLHQAFPSQHANAATLQLVTSSQDAD
ncbi:uncharacterized protein LOC111715340 [Eurytemora carolleeae]|uniref:uncharacterized protein LOC111715340 n=1 Tax=Eurytemora carolleeae TaxID=1294199 RepID=UPI000C7661E5|nr:uncharacterized protein LOC111715340 [Eurytemora carolleeae]|eukprot:XP_023346427.1 uncharacterized protein LOC111715340 [Eurytemora affinis]